ncbi:ATP-binding protein [Chishuiella sp.]|uniref:ATP-binding protein n=1 Tax=Chishuiella sp. TaxID=1969467 RepID=UPI0028AFD38A|nr:ATP-binding protein [Chishuiella sp.]
MNSKIIQKCEEEKIQFLNEIQPFGYLIGVDSITYEVNFVSENINNLLNLSASLLLGKHIDDVFDFKINYEDILKLDKGDFIRNVIVINSEKYHFKNYLYKNNIYIEIEHHFDDKFDSINYYNFSEKILHTKTIEENWKNLVDAISFITSYERVMIYKFLEDGSGIVIEENVKNGLESYIGLRFPEFDIPSQARELYLKKKSRIVENIEAINIPIISKENNQIDLSYTSIRTLSPIHLEYLKNAGAYASFSISIVVNNKLWGLVACQNSTAKSISYNIRMQCELLTRLSRISYINFKSNERIKFQNNFNETAIKLKENLLVEESLRSSITKNLKEILLLTKAEGIAFVNDDYCSLEGETPGIEEVLRIKEWAKKQGIDKLFYSNSFYKDYGKELNLSPLAAGVMFRFLDQTYNNFMIWFKKEENLKLKWAGQPHKIEKEKIDENGNKIIYYSPRTSFKYWEEEVLQKSFMWQKNEIYVAKEVLKIIIDTINTQSFKIHNLYEQLKEINEELDAFSYTVSHDLRTPLTVMKLNCQLLQKRLIEDKSSSSQIKNIIGEIDKIVEMMEEILVLSKTKKSDIQLEEIDPEFIIEKIVKELKIYYHTPNTSVDVENIYEIFGEKTMVYEVFLNTIGNAIKYSSLEAAPKIIINSYIENNNVIYHVTDNGIGIKKEDYSKMFKLFNRMSNTDGIKGNGIGLTIAQTMMKRMGGDICFESEEGNGTTFILKFRKK